MGGQLSVHQGLGEELNDIASISEAKAITFSGNLRIIIRDFFGMTDGDENKSYMPLN